MQAQNLQRYIIWGMLAAVSYLMLIQWQKDYGSEAKNYSSESVQQIVEEYQDANPGLDTVDVEEQDDLPQIAPESQSDDIKELEIEQNTTQVIRVLTDVLDVNIDLKGGDIVGVKLPEHKVSIENEESLTLLQKDITRTYIAQSGLVGKNGPDNSKEGRPLYRTENEEYVLAEGQEQLNVDLVFQDQQGVIVTKRFSFNQGSYLINVDYQINNQSANVWKANLFAQIKRDNTIDPYADTSLFAMKPFLGFAYWSPEQKYNKLDLLDVREEPVEMSHKAGWVAFLQHYFVSAWVGPRDLTSRYSTRVNKKNENIIGFTTESFSVEPNSNQNVEIAFYAGPKDQNTLETISEGLELTVDYGWLWMIAQLIFWVLINIQSVVGNWGWSIVLLTCSVKLLFFPLNQYAFKSMANMRKLQPKMQRLKDLYGDDRQKLSQATMEMYRKEKINPLGSCLPMLIQMPVFIALYWVLSESVEIRHAPFMGWIVDLSIMDPYFVLPGLMAVTMIVQQRISPMVFQDPMQEKIMKMMPIMFAVFFLFFPAGLVLYWLVNNILTIAQQWLINRSVDNE